MQTVSSEKLNPSVTVYHKFHINLKFAEGLVKYFISHPRQKKNVVQYLWRPIQLRDIKIFFNVITFSGWNAATRVENKITTEAAKKWC